MNKIIFILVVILSEQVFLKTIPVITPEKCIEKENTDGANGGKNIL